VKDNIDVAGMATTAACPAFAYEAEDDAEVVMRLKRAGAIVIGKTNLDQFATGLVGVRTPYPAPRNPLRRDLIPGGSSAGSAVAVATGIVPFALGTDTAGSGRVPAMLNNIVGLKPSLGLLSTRGVVPACRTLDCVSVFALNVDDAWKGLCVITGYDPKDPYSRERALGVLRSAPTRARLGVPLMSQRQFFGDERARVMVLAEQFVFEPAALCTAGSDYVRERLREERGFAMQRSGEGRALPGSDVANRFLSLMPVVCLCMDYCWLQLQLWVLNRLQKKPFEIGWRGPLLS
jgi:allophanate hydrolase